MINKLKYALISDIGIFNPTFYEKGKEKELLAFCERWGIDCLPAKDRISVYRIVDNQFVREDPDPRLVVKPYYRIFDPRTITKLGEYNPNELRFIEEGGLIKGVMHIVDYNNEFIQVEIFRALYRFEINLRRFLIKKGKRDDDFIKWVRHLSQNAEDSGDRYHWGLRYNDLMPENRAKREGAILKRKELNPFQTLFLKELMQYTISEKFLEEKYIDIENVNALRNQIAHNVYPTSFERVDGEITYNYENLKLFVDKVRAFFEAYDYLQRMMER